MMKLRQLIPHSFVRIFDAISYKKSESKHRDKSIQITFNEIFNDNLWGSSESISGVGSDMEQCETIIIELPKLFQKYHIKSILDVPCGDFNWFSKINLNNLSYTGGDIVEAVTISNNKKFSNENRVFITLNLVKDVLPACDVLLCRDCLVHLSYAEIKDVLKNVCNSKATYFLTTSFPKQLVNNDIVTGDWRPLNFQISPFNFPKPQEIITENCTERNGKYSDKALALWKVEDLKKLILKSN